MFTLITTHGCQYQASRDAFGRCLPFGFGRLDIPDNPGVTVRVALMAGRHVTVDLVTDHDGAVIDRISFDVMARIDTLNTMLGAIPAERWKWPPTRWPQASFTGAELHQWIDAAARRAAAASESGEPAWLEYIPHDIRADVLAMLDTERELCEQVGDDLAAARAEGEGC